MTTNGVADSSNRKLLNRTGAAVSGALLAILGASMYGIMKFDIPKDNHDIMLVLITVVANSVTGVVSYFFGSSAATSRQGEIIAQQAATQDKLASTAAAVVAAAPIAEQPSMKQLVKPIEVTQQEWDAMNDAEKGAAVLKYSKP